MPAARADKTRPLPVIDGTRCTGCGWCVAACPLDLLALERHGWKKRSELHDADRCTGCAYCALKCPFGVITMVVPAPDEPSTTDARQRPTGSAP